MIYLKERSVIFSIELLCLVLNFVYTMRFLIRLLELFIFVLIVMTAVPFCIIRIVPNEASIKLDKKAVTIFVKDTKRLVIRPERHFLLGKFFDSIVDTNGR